MSQIHSIYRCWAAVARLVGLQSEFQETSLDYEKLLKRFNSVLVEMDVL